MAATYTCRASLSRSARSPGPSVTRCRAGAVVTTSSHHGGAGCAPPGGRVVAHGTRLDVVAWAGSTERGRTIVRFEGHSVAGGGSVAAGWPPQHGTARRGGSTQVDEAGGARREHGRAPGAAGAAGIPPSGVRGAAGV